MASRGIWSKVFSNFIASLRPRQIKGNLVGQDYMQTKYYEIPAGTVLLILIYYQQNVLL